MDEMKKVKCVEWCEILMKKNMEDGRKIFLSSSLFKPDLLMIIASSISYPV